jgi:hypothetical protein
MIQTMTCLAIMGVVVVDTQTHTEVIHSKCLMYPIKVQKLLKGEFPQKTESFQMKDPFHRIGHLCKSILLQGSEKCTAPRKNLISMG